jgi:hypothetical protein
MNKISNNFETENQTESSRISSIRYVVEMLLVCNLKLSSIPSSLGVDSDFSLEEQKLIVFLGEQNKYIFCFF